MFVKFRINFNKPVPTPERILEELKNSTGLVDIRLNDKKDEFIHPLFQERFTLDYEENLIEINVIGEINKWYLLEATRATLEELGGKSNSRIEEWGRKKWKEVKDLPPEILYNTSLIGQ